MTEPHPFEEVKMLFTQRCEEVRRYFEFLRIISEHRATAVARFDTELEDPLVVKDVISRSLVKTMRANGYLLLYNLVESTMTNAVDAIHQCFLFENCEFDELTEEVKRIALFNFKRAISGDGNGVLSHEHPIARSIIELGYDKLKLFSGNVDAKLIRHTAERYGFRIADHDTALTRNGERLLNVKVKRNELAHGRVSFEECGHDVSLDELISISQETETYLGAVIAGIEEYVKQKSYRASVPA